MKQMKNKMLMVAALAGAQLALTVPAGAQTSFEGLAPLVLPDCVPENERPYADEPEYRELSDTRPTCLPKPKRVPKPRKPAPKPYVVPQK
ncbi:MAG: hypothetical protein ABJN42_29150 [Roseibium sp.]|uniref:hypothetical protein n=1 Tax=Hyphomicrobiales TaxID=356 RepID=UPI0032979D91